MTEEMLTELRKKVSSVMSEKRFNHTVEVEKMVARLADLYIPEKKQMLRAAALLHDITKEYTTSRQIKYCSVKNIPLTEEDLLSPKRMHARTAAALIPERYPDFADPEIIACVRWHTTGRKGMTLCESLVYLADYIDLSRTFEDCVMLRNYFWNIGPENLTMEKRLTHLRDTLILSFDMTIRGLLDDGAPIGADTMEARNELVCACLKAREAATI